MAKVLKANVFSVKSLRQLKKDLEQYRDSLEGKTKTFISILLDEGIRVAQEKAVDEGGKYGTHEMVKRGHIMFTRDSFMSNGAACGIMYGTGGDILGQWYINDGNGNYTLETGFINSLMAIEFGTAAKALPKQESFDVVGGKGTLAKYGHDNDLGWYIVTKIDGKGKPIEWKEATAITPTQPMYYAGLAMYEKIKEAAITAFG